MVAMPGLAAPNQVVVPRPPAPYGAPAAEIGPVLQVASDLDADGFATDPEFGPMTMGRRIGLAIVIAIVAFGLSWFAAMLWLVNGHGDQAALPALAAMVGFVALFWRSAGKTKRWGTCVYLGAGGFTRTAVRGGSREVTTMLFRDGMTTTSTHKDVIINGIYAYTLESVEFWNPDATRAGILVGTYSNRSYPSPHAMLVRTATQLMSHRRYAAG